MGAVTASTRCQQTGGTRREADHNGGFVHLSNFLEIFLCDKHWDSQSHLRPYSWLLGLRAYVTGRVSSVIYDGVIVTLVVGTDDEEEASCPSALREPNPLRPVSGEPTPGAFYKLGASCP